MKRMSIEAALAALAAIEEVAAALVKTAPNAVAAMGGAESIMARADLTVVGPIPKLSIEEWSAIAAEHHDRLVSNPVPLAPA